MALHHFIVLFLSRDAMLARLSLLLCDGPRRRRCSGGAILQCRQHCSTDQVLFITWRLNLRLVHIARTAIQFGSVATIWTTLRWTFNFMWHATSLVRRAIVEPFNTIRVYKKLSYRRGTARRAMLGNSFSVSRALGVIKGIKQQKWHSRSFKGIGNGAIR